MKIGRCFTSVDPVLEGKAKCIAIDKGPNDHTMHAFRLGKADRTTDQPGDPGPKIDVLALDFRWCPSIACRAASQKLTIMKSMARIGTVSRPRRGNYNTAMPRL